MSKNRDNSIIATASENSISDVSDMQRVTLKQLRKMAGLTQADFSETMGVGQDTISRLEKRHDMLLSTISHYVESLGGRVDVVATFPNRQAIVLDCLEEGSASTKKNRPPDTSKKV
ncbi:MAG: helix-turn-helix transcriptional regulator [Alcaligenaceae bacterium]|jgi:DNA-binding XRE family transcriptional regulator|nr:helix-turn-helix transcriptional regulator [Alcaligenaceae bacterium]